ncbi:hypothetical protein N3K66_009055 [Trichothecium roseum]|uniref:Uncharacterized protein n=1 Tax=Trichothecium roseum TaxID=47278 RepID=A0ACC0UQ42_9HYPO|nr:hypothetical protein N3K66_009055 [Trichothecium roseum]
MPQDNANGAGAEDAWDTHIHVFEPEKYPYSPNRSYTPAAAPLEDYLADATGCRNIVIVQGTAAATLLDRLQRQPPPASGGRLRGLAVMDLDEHTDGQLDNMHSAGVRGVRMHLVSCGFGHQDDNDAVSPKLKTTAQRLSRLGWVLDLFTHPKAWAAAAHTIRALPRSTKIVADHWAGFRPGDEDTPEFAAFLALVRDGRVHVKLSAFERQYHGHARGMAALKRMGQMLVAANSDRVLYASDWPNTALASSREGRSAEDKLRIVEDGRYPPRRAHVDALRKWMGNETIWRKIRVETPSRLFI